MSVKSILLIIKSVLCIFLMVQFCGCSSVSDEEKDPFEVLYTSQIKTPDVLLEESINLKKFDFSADSMPFPMFIRWLSDRSEVGFIYQEGVEKKNISAEIKSATLEEIVDTVSRSLKMKFLKVGNIYFIGELRKEDRGVFVQRVLSVDKTFLKQSVDALLSETGKCSVSNDCVLVVSDYSSVLSRISSMTNKLESSTPGTWILQFYITIQKKNMNLNAGANVNTSGALSYALTKEQGDSNVKFTDSGSIGQNVELLLTNKSEYIDLISAPLLLLRDGATGEWYDGVTTPIPEYTVSSYGVRTVSGYKDYKTGFSLKSTLRESRDGCILKCEYESSNITGYTDMVPHISKSSLSFEVELRSHQIYLVGELSADQVGKSWSNLLNFGKEDGFTKVQIWVRAYKVFRIKKPYKKEI